MDKNTKTDQKKVTNKTRSTINEIDYDKLANAIVMANERYEREKKLRIEEHNNKEVEEWHNKIGYVKDKPLTKIVAFFRMLFMNAKDIKGDRATTVLLSFVASGIMFIGMVFMFLLAIISFMGVILSKIIIPSASIPEIIILFFIFCFALIFGNLFRLSFHEIENLQNKDYLNTVLSSILTIVGTILALAEIFRR